jgi:hypothetical protein
MLARIVAAVAAGLLLAGCSFENHNEREADQITRAIIANDFKPVANDVAKGIAITRVQIAQWSDELNAQGKLISVKETPEGCETGWHCFTVKFQKHTYTEKMRFDENGKVVNWNFHMVSQ